ncbi:MAG: uracil phosphoribosyltransferase [Candidatus Coatesbacteria bacterium]|nr:uracil phosphoribosyltransferase [Candidatus Coatesbacteria bacterium]
MKNLLILEHPLIQELLTKLRDKKTSQIPFRKGLVTLGRIMGYELIKTMSIKKIKVETPIGQADGVEIPDRDNIVIVQILRASMPFVEGLIKAFPEAKMGVVSAKRIEGSNDSDFRFKIEMDYMNVPEISQDTILLLADPMLASGSTLLKVIDELLKLGNPKRLIVAAVIASPLGVERLFQNFPQAELIVAALDPSLNDNGYIVPGLGDAGDRAFGG